MKSDDLSGQITLKIQPKTCFFCHFGPNSLNLNLWGGLRWSFATIRSKFYLLPFWPKKSSQTWKKISGQVSQTFCNSENQKFISGSSKGCWIDDKGCRLTPSLRVQTAPFGRCWSELMQCLLWCFLQSAFITPSSTCLFPPDVLWPVTYIQAKHLAYNGVFTYKASQLPGSFVLLHQQVLVWPSKAKLAL